MTELMNIVLGWIPPMCQAQLHSQSLESRTSIHGMKPRTDSSPRPRSQLDPSPLSSLKPLESRQLPFANLGPSLLHASAPSDLPPTAFYVDDIFSGHQSFEQALYFLEYHLLPQIAWSMLKLSFKKLVLFTNTIEALGPTRLGELRK